MHKAFKACTAVLLALVMTVSLVNGALAAAQKLVTHEAGFYTFDQVMFA